MLARVVNEGTKRPKKKVSTVVQKEKVDEERMQGGFFGKKMNNMKGMRKSGNKGLKRGISKNSSIATKVPRMLTRHRAIEPRVRRLEDDPPRHFFSFRECHIGRVPEGTTRRQRREYLVKSSENVKIKSSRGTSHQ